MAFPNSSSSGSHVMQFPVLTKLRLDCGRHSTYVLTWEIRTAMGSKGLKVKPWMDSIHITLVMLLFRGWAVHEFNPFLSVLTSLKWLSKLFFRWKSIIAIKIKRNQPKLTSYRHSKLTSSVRSSSNPPPPPPPQFEYTSGSGTSYSRSEWLRSCCTLFRS